MPRLSRRPGSRLSALAAAVSLVLCSASVALWVRSYWVHDVLVIRHSSGRPDTLRSVDGILVYVGQDGLMRAAAAERYYADPDHAVYALSGSPWRTFGFGMEQWMGQTIVTSPHWSIALAFLLIPVMWLASWRRSRGRGFPVSLVINSDAPDESAA